jgi:hypothetical protein
MAELKPRKRAAGAQATVAPVDPSESPAIVRDRELEALWFQLDDAVEAPLAFVPAPGLNGRSLLAPVERLAEIGSSIVGQKVDVINALGTSPHEADGSIGTVRAALSKARRALVVTDSPTQDAGATAVIDLCAAAVVVVGLQRSYKAEVEEIIDLIDDRPVIGIVCLERGRKKRAKAGQGRK